MSSSKYLFYFPEFRLMAKKLVENLDIKLGSFAMNRFSNQELTIFLDDKVEGATCYLLGSLSPPDGQIFPYLALCDTLKKNGAKSCVGILPYLAYTRHDHEERGKSALTQLMGKLLAASGIDGLVTVDIHSHLAADVFPFKVTSLSIAKLIVRQLEKEARLPDLLISPDKGAFERTEEVKDLLQKKIPILCFDKKRNEIEITHENIGKQMGKRCVIIDDILDTGGTLLSCVKQLSKQGAEEITIFVTHGLFTSEKWKALFDFKVKAIYCTNTLFFDKKEVQLLDVTETIKKSVFEKSA